MNVDVVEGGLLDQAVDAAVVPIGAGDPARTPLVESIDARLGGELGPLLADARFEGKLGKAVVVPTLGRLPARRIVLVGFGPAGGRTEESIATAFGAAALAARDAGARSIAAALPAELGSRSVGRVVEAMAIGARLALYRFTKYAGAGRDDDRSRGAIEAISFSDDRLDGAAAEAALSRADAIAGAVILARDLVNEPASVLTPAGMAERAEEIAGRSGLGIDILDEARLSEIGANAILAVGAGSSHKPCLIRLRYTPDEPTTSGARVVGLVGKCITFDTGGYSIKTYEGMLEMKGDMAGGAAVLGAMSALRAVDCPVPVEATICAAENMISGDAFRPGDILTAMNGVTIEVLSTDAEGRLVLADGLVDTARRGATELIDLATLTGAAVVALGQGTTALFASDDALADRLLAASRVAGERMWRMPLIGELNEQIRGDVGDIKNSGGRHGGAITAALFLQRFSEGLPWAHLDIAGSARLSKNGPGGPKGGSGVGVRTLLEYLRPDPS